MSDEEENVDRDRHEYGSKEAWLRLRGILEDVYAEYGGGEAYLRKERQEFKEDMERREAMIDAALRKDRLVASTRHSGTKVWGRPS